MQPELSPRHRAGQQREGHRSSASSSQAVEERHAVRRRRRFGGEHADRGAVQPRDRRGRAVRDQDGRRRDRPTRRPRSRWQEARDRTSTPRPRSATSCSRSCRSAFGRIAAQAAKQNIIQKVRDAERDIIYNEFKDRKGELSSGIVQRFEKKNIIVNLGRTDAILPEKEQIPRERYRQGDRIRAFILDVELTSKGPQIVLSRTHPGLPDQALRAGSAGDLRGHRRGEGRGARARRARQDRRRLARSRRRSGRRLRRHAGHARAERSSRSCAARRSTSSTGRRIRRSSSAARWRRPRSRRSSWTRTSTRWR